MHWRPFVVLLGLAGVVVAAPRAAAQPIPSFSGVWVLNIAKTDPAPRGGSTDRPIGGGALFATDPDPSVPLTITETISDLTIEGQRGGKIVYKLDGTRTRNEGPRGEMITTTHRKGRSLVTDIRQTVTTPSGRITVNAREVRTLSADGRTMTLEMSRTIPRGTVTRKFVFDRKS